MKNKYFRIIIFFIFLFIFKMNISYAEENWARITANDVNLRSGPGTNYTVIKILTKSTNYSLISKDKVTSEQGCSNGWYRIYYDSTTSGYVCGDYVSIINSDGTITDIYDRPWTTPKAAIVGGAKFISASYINKGQFTSYLKKFNVNPNSANKVYNHQYMANLAAPYSEAYSSYKSYRDNGLLALPLEFTIPIFLDMPDYTQLPGKDIDTSCQAEITDQNFENLLDAQSFPESYKCKLRLIHNSYPNWTFKSLITNLDFNKSIIAEQSVSSIQGGDSYYDLSSGQRVQTENGWYKANTATVGYYLDPRNFLNVERILMFETLGYSENFTEEVVQSVLKNTFMDNYSILDNQLYSAIFVEAGRTANMSSVYLASLAKQESGNNGSRATSGDEFTYKGVTYKGLYNFFNIGASSGAESPILEGLVWASGGYDNVIVGSPNETSVDENVILATLNVIKNQDCIIGLNPGMTIGEIKAKLNGYSVTVNGEDNDIIKTGQTITITLNDTTYSYTIIVSGDVDGDGVIGATDYVKIKNYIMEKAGSELDLAQSLAADVDNSNSIGATDYVKIKNSIMGR